MGLAICPDMDFLKEGVGRQRIAVANPNFLILVPLEAKSVSYSHFGCEKERSQISPKDTFKVLICLLARFGLFYFYRAFFCIINHINQWAV